MGSGLGAVSAAQGAYGPGEVLIGEITEGRDMPLAVRAVDSATNDPVARLRRLIEERQAESVEILRGWLEQDEERT
jgi:flagellar M-ring protein FliF